MNVQEVVLDIPEQSVITRDNATVIVDGIVYFRVMDPAKAAYQVQNLEQALSALAMTNIRAVIGEMDLDQTLSSRDRINSQLLAILDGDPYPIVVRAADLVVPAGAPLTVTLRDAEGQSLSARLQPEPRLPPAFPAGAAAAAPVAYAIALYEEAGPQWRLEALRRLLDRAAARDHLAVMAAQRILGGTAL